MRYAVVVVAALTPVLFAQTTALEPGKPVQGDLPAGQSRVYSISLPANQYLRVAVTQPVRAAVAELDDPDGRKIFEVDTRSFSRPSRIVWVTETAGAYRIAISGTGRYELNVVESRPAIADDRKRVEAERVLIEGAAQSRTRAYAQAIASYTRALELFRAMNDREREGDILQAIGFALGDSSQNDKALPYLEQALAIRRDMHDRPGEASTLISLGGAYRLLNQNDKAIAHNEQALAIFREIQDLQGQGIALNGMGNSSVRLNQYDKAIGYFQQAVAILREAGDRRGQANSLNGLGNASDHLGQPEQAIAYYEQALAIRRDIHDRVDEGGTLNNLGIIYSKLGQSDKAIAYYEQALVIRRELHDRRGEGITVTNLGLAYLHLSRFEDAIRYTGQALAIEREIKDRRGEAMALDNLAIAYDSLGQYDKAVADYQQALAIARDVKDRYTEAADLIGLGQACYNLGQREQAIAWYEQALAIGRDIKDRDSQAVALANLGQVYSSLSQFEKAIGYYEQGLALDREVGDREHEGQALNNLGDAWHGRGQNDKAVTYFVQALAVSREVKDRTGEAAELAGLMDVWQSAGQPALAIFYGKQAVNTVQSIRADIHGLGQDLQQSYLKGNERPYHTLAEILIAQGRLAEAEQVLALLKQEEYFRYIRRDAEEASTLKQRADLTPDEAEWEKRYREIAGRLMAIGSEHGDLLAKHSLTADQQKRLEQVEQDLTAGNQAFQQFLGDLNQHFSAKPAMARSIDSLRETQAIMEPLRELPSGTVAIFTLIGDDRLYAILRTPDAQKAFQYPIAAADLNAKIAAFRQVVQDPDLDPRPLAQELYKILLGDLAADLRQARAQTLMWSLDGALRYVPLAALYDGKQYLVEQYRLSVMTLAGSMNLKDHPAAKWRAAGFGVTRDFADAPALPSVSSELQGIFRVLGGEIKLDDQFTQQSLRQTLLKRYPVVHIASHFHFQPGDETKSFLQLGDGGHWSLADVKTSVNLFGGVQLLTLSACNTGLGDGAEVEGFGTLVERQGAKAVIASLWPVEDQSTSLLMQELYRIRESSRGETKLEALRQAQLELLRGGVNAPPAGERGRRNTGGVPAATAAPPQTPRFRAAPGAPFSHPFYWAPFFLMGNWL